MQILAFDIRGMTCGGCSYKVQHALGRLDGIRHSDVTLAPPRAIVMVDPTRVTPGQIEAAIKAVGFAATLRPAQDPLIPDAHAD
jgi:copper chaperone